MKLLVLGSNGQLGRCLKDQSTNFTHEYIFSDRDSIDLNNIEETKKKIRDINPDLIVNFSAYTAVDKAEIEKNEANYLNNICVKEIAKICEEIGSIFFHLSTDYVFDGLKNIPYKEESKTNPINVYGSTKRLGEIAIQECCSKYLILRTSWVYSEHGENFLKTMLKIASNNTEIKVVSDQHGCPTYGQDIAVTILNIINQIELKKNIWGIFNFTGRDIQTWHQFAINIFNTHQSINKSFKIPKIEEALSKDFDFKASRPLYSVLDNDKISKTWGINHKNLKESLLNALKKINT